MLCLFLLAFLATTEARVTLSSSLTEINANSDVPKALSITCGFSLLEGEAMSNLVSLIISRREVGSEEKFTDLISVNNVNPNSVLKAEEFTGTASGSLRVTGSSFLQAEYDEPSRAESGEYKCEAHGSDHFGRAVQEAQSITIQYIENSNSTALVARLTQQINDLLQQLSACKEGTPLSRLINLRQFIIDVEQKSLNYVHHVTDFFASTSFYIYIRNLQFDQAVQFCSGHSGYLAEINTESELLFLQGALNVTGLDWTYRYYVSGAFFSTLSSPWEFYTHKGDPMYLGHWNKDEPDRNNINYNWLVLQYLGDNSLVMNDGQKEINGEGYLCEVSVPRSIV